LDAIDLDDRSDPNLFDGYYFLFILGESNREFVGLRPAVDRERSKVELVVKNRQRM
jgi:hypothetical protein